jgi:hypothetical protein
MLKPAAVTVALVAALFATPARFAAAVEAEDGIPGNFVRTVDCGACSGGQRVTGLGGRDNGVLTFYVDIPEDADYTVTLHYVSGATRALSVNGRRVTGLNSGGWDKVATRSVTVHLTERLHRPAVLDIGYDTRTAGADLDKVVVSSRR